MMLLHDDILASKRNALSRDGWIYGERMNRIGDPFSWVDGNQIEHIGGYSEIITVMQYLAMSGEIYDTPSAIRTSDHDEIYAAIRNELADVISYMLPEGDHDKFSVYIDSTASVKVQDYCAIKSWAKDLPGRPKQLDIGPGLGANAIYSTLGLNAEYTSLEAHPVSYQVQRRFLKSLAHRNQKVLDLVECESLGYSVDAIAHELARVSSYQFRLVPSWYFDQVPDRSIDMFSATWVLNEITPAGICWLLHHASRALKLGGYFYVRDSGLRKPLRHQLNYDEALLDLGFELVERLDIVNRVDMHGIPRIYKMVRDCQTSFEGVFDHFFSRVAVSSHGGAYNQGVD